MASVSRYCADYPAIAKELPGQQCEWLVKARADALSQFSSSGFPSPREEDWRYTNVSAIEKKSFTPVLTALSDNPIDADVLKKWQLPDAWCVVFVDGRFCPALSVLDGLPQGVIVQNMVDALVQHTEQMQRYFAQAVDTENHGFIAFNTAWFTDGVYIHIPAKQVLSRPVQLLHWNTTADSMAVTRHLIVADNLAEAAIVETFAGPDQAYLSAAVTEVIIADGAHVTLTKLQAESAKAYHFGGCYVKAANNAVFTHHNFAFGGLLARTDVHTALMQAAECELNGLYLGNNRQHIDNHTRIYHAKSHALSRQLYKGVLDDRARGVFQGRVIVAEGAQKTDSQMNNRNLLLSDDAEADTKPQLEIYADDVKCGHGVTVGQLDEKSVFYLQSRGVDEETAQNMLTFAFANEMVNKVSSFKALHDLVLTQVLERFPQQDIASDWL